MTITSVNIDLYKHPYSYLKFICEFVLWEFNLFWLGRRKKRKISSHEHEMNETIKQTIKKEYEIFLGRTDTWVIFLFCFQKKEQILCAFSNVILSGVKSTLSWVSQSARYPLADKTKRILMATASEGEHTLIDDFGRSKRIFCLVFII